ncbi:MAG TPA: hypothetical protein VHE35_11260 [Kofleriaceae bacterium]|nr:hypothetical protein [Kofleriaceae bacterium]
MHAGRIAFSLAFSLASSVALAALASGCSDPGSSAGATDAAPDAPADAAPDAGGKDANCASTFGTALTNAFGRVDGTVVAVVEPGNERCALPNSDHVVVQLAFGGDVYRMVVNVKSDIGDPDIKVQTVQAPLLAPAFAPGWHPGLSVDYPREFSVHSGDAAWQSLDLAAASTWVSDPIEIGAPISVYATSSGGTTAGSAHLVHRNGQNHDGAIVIDPTGASPRWLLFSFADQTF